MRDLRAVWATIKLDSNVCAAAAQCGPLARPSRRPVAPGAQLRFYSQHCQRCPSTPQVGSPAGQTKAKRIAAYSKAPAVISPEKTHIMQGERPSAYLGATPNQHLKPLMHIETQGRGQGCADSGRRREAWAAPAPCEAGERAGRLAGAFDKGFERR